MNNGYQVGSSAIGGFMQGYNDYTAMRMKQREMESDIAYRQSLMDLHKAQGEYYRQRETEKPHFFSQGGVAYSYQGGRAMPLLPAEKSKLQTPEGLLEFARQAKDNPELVKLAFLTSGVDEFSKPVLFEEQAYQNVPTKEGADMLDWIKSDPTALAISRLTKSAQPPAGFSPVRTTIGDTTYEPQRTIPEGMQLEGATIDGFRYGMPVSPEMEGKREGLKEATKQAVLSNTPEGIIKKQSAELAMKLLQKRLDEKEDPTGEIWKQAKDYSLLADREMNLGNFDKAMEYMGEAENLVKSTKDVISMPSTKVKMRSPEGDIYDVDSTEADEAELNGWVRAE